MVARIVFLSIEGECAAVMVASRAHAAVVVAEPVAVDTARAVESYVWSWDTMVQYCHFRTCARTFHGMLEESSVVQKPSGPWAPLRPWMLEELANWDTAESGDCDGDIETA